MIIPAEEVVQKFKDAFGDKILDVNIQETMKGVRRQIPQRIIRMKIEGDIFYDAFSLLCDIDYPHASAPMTFRLHEDKMELIYVFAIFSGSGNYQELPVIFQVMLDKDKPRVRSVADLLPGMILYERETIEMLGVDIVGAKDRRNFLMPKSVYEKEKGMLPYRADLGFGFDDYYKRREKEEADKVKAEENPKADDKAKTEEKPKTEEAK